MPTKNLDNDVSFISSILLNASDSDPRARHEAEQKLKEFEESPGFHGLLSDISCDSSNDTRLRLLALLYIKNGVDRYWRKTAPHAFSLQEKNHIKSRLMSCLREENRSIVVQYAVTLSKIARHEFPAEWPDLLNVLLGLLEGGNTIKMRNVLLYMHHVVKVLSSKTLPTSRRQFEQVSPLIFNTLSPAYAQGMQRFVTSPDLQDFTMVLSCLKILRRIIVFGYKDWRQHPEIVDFLLLTLQHAQYLHQLRPSLVGSDMLRLVSSARHTIGKLYLDLENAKLLEFVLASCCSPILSWYWQQLIHPTTFVNDDYAEKFTIQAMMLWKSVIKPTEMEPSKGETPNPNLALAKQVIETQLVTPEFLANALPMLITSYTPFTSSDLELWEESPEDFVDDLVADHWEYNPKACAEKLIIDLVGQHGQETIPNLVKMVQQVDSIKHPTSLTNILLKDSVYNAVALTAGPLYDHIDFDSWLVNLAKEATMEAPDWKIVQRSVAQLIGYWVSVKISKPNRPLVFQIMLHLLQPERDLVVRLSAVANLQACVDEWDFEPSAFEPYLQPTLVAFANLLSSVDEFATKMTILNCMSVIVERMEQAILPYALEITQLLPPLWDAAQDQHMFRSAILVIVCKLVSALQSQSSNIQSLVVPLIANSVDPSQPGFLYQVEEGLELWLATVQNATKATPELNQLVHFLPILLEHGSEGLKKVLKLVECNLLLDPASVMQHSIFNQFANLIEEMRPEAAAAIVNAMDIYIQVANAQHQLPHLLQLFSQNNFLDRLLSIIIKGSEIDAIVVGYLAILARLCVCNPEAFVAMIREVSVRMQHPNLVGELVQVMVDRMDAVVHPKRRKLFSMALLQLLPHVPDQVSGIFAVLSSIMGSIKESGDDLIYWHEQRQEHEDPDSPDAARRKQLMSVDPVYTTHLLPFCRSHLQSVQASIQPFLAQTDHTIIDSLMKTLH